MKSMEEMIEEGRVKKLIDNFHSDRKLSKVLHSFNQKSFVEDYRGTSPIFLLPLNLLIKEKDGINHLDLGCGPGNQITDSSFVHGTWSTGLDGSIEMFEKAANELVATPTRSWQYKKVIALVHADMTNPMENDMYALLHKKGITGRLKPKLCKAKERKTKEVQEVFNGSRDSFFSIITSSFSFPQYIKNSEIEDVIKTYVQLLKPGGLWITSYATRDGNPLGFCHKPLDIKEKFENNGMSLVTEEPSHCCKNYTKQTYEKVI